MNGVEVEVNFAKFLLLQQTQPFDEMQRKVVDHILQRLQA